MFGVACRCLKGLYGLCSQKIVVELLTCLVVLRGTGTESCLCFASFGNLSALECLPRRHLLKASKDLLPNLLGQGPVGGASSSQTKSRGRRRLKRNMHESREQHTCPGPDKGSEKTWKMLGSYPCQTFGQSFVSQAGGEGQGSTTIGG